MNKKTIISSVVCCVALNGIDESMAMEYRSIKNINAIEREATVVDERYIVENTILKSGKSEMALEVGKLKANDKVEVLKEENGWAKVKVRENIGYVKLTKLRKTNISAVDKYLECLSYLKVYKDTSGQKDSEIGKIYNNEKISILEEMGPYIKIKINGEEAFIKNKKEYLVDKKQRVATEGAKIYSSLYTNQFKQLKDRTALVVEEELDNYFKVSYNGGQGYIRKEEALDMKYVKGTISYPVKLHVSESEYSKVRAYITPGAEVQLIGYGKEYVKVKYGEYEGYVLYSNLSIEDPSLKKYESMLGENEEVYLSKNFVNRDEIEVKYNKILDKYEKNIAQQQSELNNLLKEFGVIKKSTTDINIMSNKGRYLEVGLDGKIYYMDNVGEKIKKNTLDKRYIETYPKIKTTVNTRYIDESDTNVYLDESRKISLGALAEDSQVEFVEDVDRSTSKIKVNGNYVYVAKECLDKEKMYVTVKEDINKKNTGKSHKSYVKAISKYLNIFVGSSENRKATEEEVAYYSNPNNRNVKDKDYKYQYLKLDEFRMVDANIINEYLNSLEGKEGKNIFENKADVFIESAKKYNIDPIYLISHTMLETGYGTSNLARGQVYEEENVTVYNFFGIGAIDSDPLEGGKRAAFNNGWTSIDKTIEGSAKWLSLNYIHSEDNKQNTLYKMRYNYMTRSHQYASDIMWASKISTIMQNLSKAYIDTTLTFEVPVYVKGTYMKGVADSGKSSEKEKEEKTANNIEDSPTKGEKPQIDDKKDDENKNESDEKPSVDEKPIEKPGVGDDENKEEVETPEVGDDENKEEVETPEVGDDDSKEEVETPEVGDDENKGNGDTEVEGPKNEEEIDKV